jgi:hypothetical protein
VKGCFEEDFSRISKGLLTRTCTRFHEGLCKSFAEGPLKDHASATDSISIGSPQDLVTVLDQYLHAGDT